MARLNYTTVDRNGYKYLCYRVRDENGKYVPVYAKTAKELEKKVHLREKEIQLRIKIKAGAALPEKVLAFHEASVP